MFNERESLNQSTLFGIQSVNTLKEGFTFVWEDPSIRLNQRVVNGFCCTTDMTMTLMLNTKRLILIGLMTPLIGLSYVQQITSDDLSNHIPKRLISRVELLIGANIIYASGSETMKDIRVPKLGFHSQLGLIHAFNSKFEGSLKVTYESKAYPFEVYSENLGPPPTDRAITDVTLNYVTAILLPRYNLLPKRKLELGIGPYFGYMTTTRLVQKLYYQNELVRRYSARPPGTEYEDFDWGLTATVGSNFALDERLGVSVQFLYSRGLTDINRPIIDQLRNNTFTLVVGLCRSRTSY